MPSQINMLCKLCGSRLKHSSETRGRRKEFCDDRCRYRYHHAKKGQYFLVDYDLADDPEGEMIVKFSYLLRRAGLSHDAFCQITGVPHFIMRDYMSNKLPIPRIVFELVESRALAHELAMQLSQTPGTTK